MGSSDKAGMGRRALGPVGVFLPNNPGAPLPPAEVQRDAVRRLERAGYRAVWNVVARPGSPYGINLTRLGYAAEDISAASDEVVDAVTAWGSRERIAAAVRRHLDAGADHVRLGVVAPDFQSGIGALERLAPALTQ